MGIPCLSVGPLRDSDCELLAALSAESEDEADTELNDETADDGRLPECFRVA